MSDFLLCATHQATMFHQILKMHCVYMLLYFVKKRHETILNIANNWPGLEGLNYRQEVRKY